MINLLDIPGEERDGDRGSGWGGKEADPLNPVLTQALQSAHQPQLVSHFAEQIVLTPSKIETKQFFCHLYKQAMAFWFGSVLFFC